MHVKQDKHGRESRKYISNQIKSEFGTYALTLIMCRYELLSFRGQNNTWYVSPLGEFHYPIGREIIQTIQLVTDLHMNIRAWQLIMAWEFMNKFMNNQQHVLHHT